MTEPVNNEQPVESVEPQRERANLETCVYVESSDTKLLYIGDLEEK